MHSDRITNRITDLLKLSGVSDKQTIEELTDHYLSHIEEEVKRGVNSQRAVRETYQEIANLDTSLFAENQEQKNKRGMLLFFLLFIGIAFYLFQQNPLKTKRVLQLAAVESSTEIRPPMGFPVLQANYDITSEFGFRVNPVYKRKVKHSGIDIRAKIGTPVLATGSGVVTESGYKPRAGNFIILQHEGNFLTKYYHLSSIDVNTNEKVRAGQLIGKVGNTGKSTGPHLHYEVLKDNVPLNPRKYIRP